MTGHETTGIEVCNVDDLPPGACRIVVAGGRRIGVFNVRGSYYALLDRCPHGGAPLCQGRIGGMSRAKGPGQRLELVREGEILHCPWHGWEFEISTGATITEPVVRVKTFKVEAKDGRVLVEL